MSGLSVPGLTVPRTILTDTNYPFKGSYELSYGTVFQPFPKMLDLSTIDTRFVWRRTYPYATRRLKFDNCKWPPITYVESVRNELYFRSMY